MANENTDAKTDKKSEPKTSRQQQSNQWRSIFNNTWHNIQSKGFWANFIVTLIFLFLSPIIAVSMNTYKYAIYCAAIGFTMLIWLIAISAIRSIKPPELPETELHGYLVPAADPTPQTPCKNPPPNAATIFLGTNAAWIIDTPVVIVRVDGLDLLTLKNTPDGLSVFAKVFSDDSKIIADIENNEFNVNPNNYFKVKRLDKSSLIVYDQQDRAVLNVRFLNPKNIRVSGIFNAPNQKPIIIDDKKINRPSPMAGSCFKNVPFIIQFKGEENAIGASKLL